MNTMTCDEQMMPRPILALSPLKKLFKKAYFAYTGRFGPLPQPEKWVFVVGCYNSGTTLLTRLLGTHPAVGTLPREGQFCSDQLLTPLSQGLPRLWVKRPELFWMDEQTEPEADLQRLKRQWGALFNDPHRPVLLEKTPANAARTRWLQRHFENAHFIAIVRNGYAVAEGIARKTGCDLATAARQWAYANQIMLRDFSKLRHKRLITYETLTDGPDEVLAGLFDFLGLPPLPTKVTDQKWQIHEQQGPVRNLNAQSFAALSPADCRVIESMAGELLAELGYTPTGTTQQVKHG